MALYRPYLILSLTICLFLIFSSCQAYQLFRDISIPNRPIKYHVLSDSDRNIDRMKQYHDTMAQLKHWGRSVDEFDNDVTNHYKNPADDDKH
ncbi:unnamed protein product [Adineta ricciae]|uniref:Uncharacterized protein n=1 Tax=Adineta ricciae TaxID=249248 RepID=A0A813MKI9_ADIRI|nr:unnamed protein product [Adineta ricciae]